MPGFLPLKTAFAGALIVFAVANSAMAEDEFVPDESLVYKTVGDLELKLFVFRPEGHQADDAKPAIVFFFGGGWNGGSASQFYSHCQHLADRGMVAISAEYRVRNVHGTSPQECVMDGKSVIRWVRRNAARLGIDPDQIAAGGGSAGGHVAAATATVSGFEEEGEDLAVSARPNALVLFNPVFDNGPTGYGHDRVKAYWREFSPMHNISDTTPPTLVMLGTRDRLIPVATGEEFKRRMEQHGRRCDLKLYEGAEHGFFNHGRGDGGFYRSTVADMDRFLVSLGYLTELQSGSAE